MEINNTSDDNGMSSNVNDEKILSIIEKFVNSKVSIDELQQVAPFLNTSDFKETFQLIESIEIAVKPLGRAELKTELKSASNKYHEEIKVVKLKNFTRWLMPAAAACILVIVGISSLQSMKSNLNKYVYHSYSGGAASIKNEKISFN